LTSCFNAAIKASLTLHPLLLVCDLHLMALRKHEQVIFPVEIDRN